MSISTSPPLVYDPTDEAFHADPLPTYERLRDEAPVHHEQAGDHPFWVLSRFEHVFHAARDTERYSSAQGLTYVPDEIAKLGLPPTIVMMDPPRHTAFRRLVSRAFTPRRVTALEPVIRAFVRSRLDRFDADEVDFIAELAGPLPTLVVATFLGVPAEDRARFDGWSDALVQANAAGTTLTAAIDALAHLADYFVALIDTRRAAPSDDLLSDLLHAEVDGERLTTEEILGFCFVMIAGGNDTTTGLLGGSAVLLDERRDQRRLLIEQPGLLPTGIEELLRLTSPVQGLSRTTTTQVTVLGTDIPAGAKVHLLYASANRDPREFGPDADLLDVTRTPNRMVSFSSGPHFCLGAAAARLQATIALEELLARYPDFRVDAGRAVRAPGAFVRRFSSLPMQARG